MWVLVSAHLKAPPALSSSDCLEGLGKPLLFLQSWRPAVRRAWLHPTKSPGGHRPLHSPGPRHGPRGLLFRGLCCQVPAAAQLPASRRPRREQGSSAG